MAVLYIAEYAAVGNDTNQTPTALAKEPVIAEQTVAIGVGSVQSSAFNAATSFVRIHTDAICSIAFGTNPTATATKKRLAANATEYFAVPQNQAFKVAVITNT